VNFGRIRIRDQAGVSLDIRGPLEAVPLIATKNPELAERLRIVLTSALWAQQRSDATHGTTNLAQPVTP
jgi:hypothetical protein